MISGVNSAAFSGMNTMGRSQELSEEQSTQLQEIISKYDPSSMTQKDHASMRQELKDAGIGPSREVGEALRAAGFGPPPRAEQAGPAGGMQGPPPPPPQESSDEEITDEMLLLTDYLEKLDSGQTTDEDEQTLLESMQAQGMIQQGLIVDELT